MGIEINKQQTDMGKYMAAKRIASIDAVTLYVQLEQRRYADIKVDERAALDEVKASSEEVRGVRVARHRASPASLREPRNQTTVAVTSLAAGLGAVGAVPAELGPEGAEANALIARLFPNGTGYTKGDAGEVWEDTAVLLQVIEAEGLAPRIDALVHPCLLRAVRAAHEKLGRAVGESGEVAAAASPRALRAAMSRFTFAVAQYARVIAGRVRHDDEASLAQFLAAVAPIDAVRVLGDHEEDDDVTEPTEPGTPMPVNGSPSPVLRSE